MHDERNSIIKPLSYKLIISLIGTPGPRAPGPRDPRVPLGPIGPQASHPGPQASHKAF